MNPSTRSTVCVFVTVCVLSACRDSPDVTSDPATGTTTSPAAAPPGTTIAITTTTQPVTPTLTTLAPTTTVTSAIDDPGDVYALDLGSGDVTRLTTDPRQDGAPAWMPDGERLLFGRLVSGPDETSGNTDIFLIAADGNAERQLTDHPDRDITPRSSPDGTSVVFASDRDDNWEIYLLTIDTGQLRRLTNDPSADRFPSFSPDGRTIAFTSDRRGDDDLYIMGVTGSPVRALTATPGTDWLAEYSPDGTMIAFATDHSIDLIDADGRSRRTLTVDAANHPSWSPDGRRIAAVTSTTDGHFAICTIDVSTATLTVVTGDEADAFYPAWSPLGDTIVFASGPRGR